MKKKPPNPHLRRLIADNKYTEVSFAQAIGISQAYLSRLIHTQRWPGLETALKIASTLGTTPASIWPIGGRVRVPSRRGGE